MDLTKPLLAKFKFRNQVQRIEYEGLHLVCCGCGVYGHKKEECPKDRSHPISDEPIMRQDDEGRTSETGQRTKELTPGKNNKQPEETESFGPWMLAPRRPRHGQSTRPLAKDDRKATIRIKEGGTPRNSESRYAALVMEEMEEILEDNINGPEQKDKGSAPNLTRRGKHPAVQVSGKQISIDLVETSTPHFNKQWVIRNKNMGNPQRGSRTHRRAAEAKHVVVRGTKIVGIISTTTVNNDNEVHFVPETNEEDMPEHHQDPPSSLGHMRMEDMEEDEPRIQLSDKDLPCDMDHER